MPDIFDDNNINSGLQFSGSPINLDNDTTIAEKGGVAVGEAGGNVTAGTFGATVAGDDLIQAKDSTVVNDSDVDGSIAANNGGGFQLAAQDGGELGALAFGGGTAVNDSTLAGSNVGVGGDVQQFQGNTVDDGSALGGRDAIADNDTSLSFRNEENNLTSVRDSSNVNTAQDDSTADADQDQAVVQDSFKSFEDNDDVFNKSFNEDNDDFDVFN